MCNISTQSLHFEGNINMQNPITPVTLYVFNLGKPCMVLHKLTHTRLCCIWPVQILPKLKSAVFFTIRKSTVPPKANNTSYLMHKPNISALRPNNQNRIYNWSFIADKAFVASTERLFNLPSPPADLKPPNNPNFAS